MLNAHQPDSVKPPLRQRLQSGDTVWGVFIEIPAAESVEIAGHAGFDFAIVDGEHAPFTAASFAPMVRAAEAAAIPAVIRVASSDAHALQHALDSGAAGVQVPQISSLEAARAAITASRFHPLGGRGFNPFVRAAGFSREPAGEFVERSNRETVLVLQLESREAVEAADRIAALDGVDVLFVGPYDLSQSLGIPGQTRDARVLEAGARVAAAAKAHGKAAGVYAANAEDAHRWRAAGMTYLCVSVDTVLLLQAMRGLLAGR